MEKLELEIAEKARRPAGQDGWPAFSDSTCKPQTTKGMRDANRSRACRPCAPDVAPAPFIDMLELGCVMIHNSIRKHASYLVKKTIVKWRLRTGCSVNWQHFVDASAGTITGNIFTPYEMPVADKADPDGPVNPNDEDYWNAKWDKEGRRPPNRQFYEAIKKLIPTRSLALDVGCGSGDLLQALIVGRGIKAVGMDIAILSLQRLARIGIKCVHNSLPLIPLKENAFDVVMCIETLEHLEQPVKAVRSMFRVVKPGGRVIISVPDGEVWGVGGEHIQAFTARDCVNLVRPFVDTVNLEAWNDSGWPRLLFYGDKAISPVRYKGRFRQTNKEMRNCFSEAYGRSLECREKHR